MELTKSLNDKIKSIERERADEANLRHDWEVAGLNERARKLGGFAKGKKGVYMKKWAEFLSGSSNEQLSSAN